MNKKKIGFWKWLWQLIVKTPYILRRTTESFLLGAFFEFMVGWSTASVCVLGLIDPKLGQNIPRFLFLAIAIVSVLIGLHGIYRVQTEDC